MQDLGLPVSLLRRFWGVTVESSPPAPHLGEYIGGQHQLRVLSAYLGKVWGLLEVPAICSWELTGCRSRVRRGRYLG